MLMEFNIIAKPKIDIFEEDTMNDFPKMGENSNWSSSIVYAEVMKIEE